jgi:hypothetical protein
MFSDTSLDAFHRASIRYPSLLHDVNKFGEPISFSPPTWRCWQVEEWRFYARNRNRETHWQPAETYWISSLAEIQALHDRLPSTSGMYMYSRLIVSTWVWSYHEQYWQESGCF